MFALSTQEPRTQKIKQSRLLQFSRIAPDKRGFPPLIAFRLSWPVAYRCVSYDTLSLRSQMEAIREVDPFWKAVLWQQFGAAIDMLENAIRVCPDEIWSDLSKQPRWVDNDVVGFWYVAYHTLFFLDLYLSDSAQGFTPPSPFNLDELDPAGLLPERPY